MYNRASAYSVKSEALMDSAPPTVPEIIPDIPPTEEGIPIRLSKKIIQLFSRGLYSTPHKALEELVSNSFDAGATLVHVIAPYLTDQTAGKWIAVVDNGEGMNRDGMTRHWIIGQSSRRLAENPARPAIGKFGIGKLASSLVADSLTHLSKKDGQYFLTGIRFDELGDSEDLIPDDDSTTLPFYELNEDQAIQYLEEKLFPATKALPLELFGPNSSESWTVAFLSRLTMEGLSMRSGRLAMVLRTAMPLLPDFRLFLNSEEMQSPKSKIPILNRWILGKDILSLPHSDLDEMHSFEDPSKPIEAVDRWGLESELLGKVSGYIELYESSLAGGKSEDIAASFGFFVHVRNV